ncbi:DUF1996 domain-containing protein [Streptomyces triticisoli]|uniref:DUF1996 domain-containing protein n=1 Tax=Streptomyces triticisoli TaxID=2182797 RepID=UPI001E3AC8DA|nr:DUF1996 domain-containing protein [Streptomyces triticisoli]
MALILGGGGLMVANVYASATEGVLSGQSVEKTDSGQDWAAAGATIDCPDVGTRLTAVPDEARATVDEQLAALDQQIAKAYQQVQSAAQDGRLDAGAVESTIMNPLKEERAGTIGRIADAIDRAGDRPEGLDDLAACTLRDAGNQDGGGQSGQDQGRDGQDQGQQGDGQQGGNGGQAGNGPVAADYVDITTVQPNVRKPREDADASRGTFASRCGVNENGLFNSDNVIVAPGVTNGAHHFHDYIGNQANNAFASDQDLAEGDTTCEDKGDRSTYYWPVLRLQDGTQERDANSPGGGIEGNAGRIVTPKQVTLSFEGNPRGKVTAMPRFLRIITGDAKAFVNGPANANASWSCTGFEDRQLKDKYPLCPQGSDVVRTFNFQSCWDGRNADSANHRAHVAFADADGNCPDGFRAIPQLVQRIVYDVDAPSLQDGGRTTPLFAVDSFPEQLHKPVTDHGDFINVFDEDLMRQMVDCINSGRQCGSGTGQGSKPTEQPQQPQQPQDPQNPQDKPTRTVEAPAGGNDGAGGKNGRDGKDRKEGGEQSAEPAEEPARGGSSTAPGTVEPKADVSRPAAEDTTGAAPASGGEVGTPTQTPVPGGNDQAAGAQTEPQAVKGGLAETGAQLWPAAAGAVLVIAGFVLLRRIRRGAM